MTRASILAIGMDPAFVDMTDSPELAPELIRHYLDSQIARVREQGFEVTSCLIDDGDTAEAMVTAALTSGAFDCVVIGAGLREPADKLLLFEKILNRVHALASGARICFNTDPADTAAAVERCLGALPRA